MPRVNGIDRFDIPIRETEWLCSKSYHIKVELWMKLERDIEEFYNGIKRIISGNTLHNAIRTKIVSN